MTNKAAGAQEQPDKYRCTKCGCYWRLNTLTTGPEPAGTWSLWNAGEKACTVCDNSPDFLSVIEPVIPPQPPAEAGGTPRADHFRREFKRAKESSVLIDWILDELAQEEQRHTAAQSSVAQEVSANNKLAINWRAAFNRAEQLESSVAEWEQRYKAISDEYALCRKLLMEKSERAEKAEAKLASYKTTDHFQLTDKMLEAAATKQRELEAELAEIKRDADRWKRLAEYEYGKYAYPNQPELRVGALDAMFRTNFDGEVGKLPAEPAKGAESS